MTARVAQGVLSGVVTTTGAVTGMALKRSIFNTSAMKLIPGEVAIVSMDAFGKLAPKASWLCVAQFAVVLYSATGFDVIIWSVACKHCFWMNILFA